MIVLEERRACGGLDGIVVRCEIMGNWQGGGVSCPLIFLKETALAVYGAKRPLWRVKWNGGKIVRLS